ncbi:MAG: hypothetical protein IKP72_06540, partial [Clostridia bacterium]|nr:hypothetical protein [Clostridia bacterium]
MTEKTWLETPSIFKGTNYHGIEYLRNKDSTFYMKTCGVQRCLPGYYYPHDAREGYHLHVVLSGKGILRVRG